MFVLFQNNALKVICPATLDVLIKVLLGNQVVGPSNAVQDHLELKEIVLQCIMKVIHIVHTSTADMVSQSHKITQVF